MIRPMVATDKGFVLDGWLRSARNLSPMSLTSEEVHNAGFGALVCDLVDRDDVLVSCDDDDTDTLFGFVAFSPASERLDYLYVKGRLRGHGVGRELLQAATSRWSRLTSSVLPKEGLREPWRYDPYSQWRGR